MTDKTKEELESEKVKSTAEALAKKAEDKKAKKAEATKKEEEKKEAKKLETMSYTEAVEAGKDYIKAGKNTTILAAKCGQKLVAAEKAAMTKTGYMKWLKESMPVGQNQCRKFVRLHQKYPDYAEMDIRSPGSVLDINSEIRLISVKKPDTEQKVRDKAAKEKLSRSQILAYIAELEDISPTPIAEGLKALRNSVSTVTKSIARSISPIESEADHKQWLLNKSDLKNALDLIEAELEAFNNKTKNKVA